MCWISKMDAEFFKQNAKNKNTKATENWYRKYLNWADENNSTRDIHLLEKKDLNEILELCFASIKRNDGGDYEPTTLLAMANGLERHLKE